MIKFTLCVPFRTFTLRCVYGETDTVSASPVSAASTQGLRSLKAHAPISRVLVFPVSARALPFSTKTVPLTQLSRFLSLSRERNSGAAGPSQQVRAVSRRLSARVYSRLAGMFHTRRPVPLFGCELPGLFWDVIIEDIIADYSMSLATSHAEECS